MNSDIFDFNHISPELTLDQELELKSYYLNSHKKCFLCKKAFQYYKKIKYGCRFVSILLTTGGVASVIVTGGVLGILAAIPGIFIETLMDYKNVHNNIISCHYAYQSYQHLMIQIKTALRLGRYDREHLVNCINNVDNCIIVTCPIVDKFKKKYDDHLLKEGDSWRNPKWFLSSRPLKEGDILMSHGGTQSGSSPPAP